MTDIDEILADACPGERRVALLSKGAVVEIRHARDRAPSLVGNVYRARVGKVAPSLDAAFLDLGESVEAFLNAADALAPLVEGETVLVQIRTDAVPGKAAVATARPALAGRYLVLRPGATDSAVSPRVAPGADRARLERFLAGWLGWTARTAAVGVDDTALAAERAALEASWRRIEAAARATGGPARLHAELPLALRLWRDHPNAAHLVVDGEDEVVDWRRTVAALWPDRVSAILRHDGAEPLFEARGVEEAIERALDPRVALPGGAELVIEETTALVAIDVNLAGAAGRGEGATLAANEAAARAVAREMRVRALAGRIVVDFVAMARREHRERVLAALRTAVADDPAGVRVFGFSATGLVEMTRRRDRESLAQTLCDPATHGRKSVITTGIDLLRAAARARPGAAPIRLRVAPEVAKALDGPLESARTALERRLARAIRVEADAGRAREGWEIG